MTAWLAYLLLALALLIICALSAYALHLWRKVARVEKFRAYEAQQARIHILENLEVVARALKEGQINLTEACLRIYVLLDLYEEGAHWSQQASWQVFQRVHQAAQAWATHQAREALDSKEKYQQDKARRALEEQLEEEILQANHDVLQFIHTQRQQHQIVKSQVQSFTPPKQATPSTQQ
ncbi:Protein of unknown function [Allopseudospirillum japonicum]|uniref:DUF2489 domain-containing protein n=1 Tax=Allopseudospirillum japonicum TaxID=64971 RepID=A0A1H6QE51_9GAMM|nr:DUF2489 domain-containing protein [Allopseudospirillum japonicum]SEI41981.1 Protein of unknown function [Allopseudospirillum japonicum]